VRRKKRKFNRGEEGRKNKEGNGGKQHLPYSPKSGEKTAVSDN